MRLRGFISAAAGDTVQAPRPVSYADLIVAEEHLAAANVPKLNGHYVAVLSPDQVWDVCWFTEVEPDLPTYRARLLAAAMWHYYTRRLLTLKRARPPIETMRRMVLKAARVAEETESD